LALKAFIVEDQIPIRDSLVEALAELGSIETAGSATTEKEAVAWLRDPAHHWDIAIVDLVLEPGGGSGFGVLQALRERPVTRKMVVLTGTANPQVRQRCEDMGADGVFDKAMETEAMLDYCVALARAAGGH
jgi:DNA-binding NarL/FixJ family response regulator